MPTQQQANMALWLCQQRAPNDDFEANNTRQNRNTLQILNKLSFHARQFTGINGYYMKYKDQLILTES